ncbi:hypothetical protein [Vibrio sonorensis]|uniref:hypothetical protein n=1 Tax=Vibrio sonorensis TaxID=1004316 RepID=UPI0008DA4678|nr:hypothetical protein [Vibrio sonorensis]
MLQEILLLLAPLLLGAQCVLTLVLVKGDICPGQRGRVHKVLPAIAILWLAIASLKIQAFLVTFAIAYFFSQVQTKKTRDEGPLWVMHLANGLAFAYTLIQASESSSWIAGINTLIQVFLCGALFAHLLLTIARTRLQAFHRILPVTGVCAAMLTSLLALAQAYQFDESQRELLIQPLLITLSLMVAATLLWCWHLISGKAPNKALLALAQLVMLTSVYSGQILFVV